MASAGPYASLHLAPDRQPHQHPTTQFFTGQMPFLPPNQQRQSTEGNALVTYLLTYVQPDWQPENIMSLTPSIESWKDKSPEQHSCTWINLSVQFKQHYISTVLLIPHLNCLHRFCNLDITVCARLILFVQKHSFSVTHWFHLLQGITPRMDIKQKTGNRKTEWLMTNHVDDLHHWWCLVCSKSRCIQL